MSDKQYVFISDGQVLVPESAVQALFWSASQAASWLARAEQRSANVGAFRDAPCEAVAVSADVAQQMEEAGAESVPLRSLMPWGEDLFAFAGRCTQLLDSYKEYRFCGRCGGATEPLAGETAMHCSPCNHSYYPRLSPCAIMLVTRGEQCLLARHGGRGDYFTCLAGFVEPGETVESTVRREVYEEVGVSVNAPKYVASQYWPFPGQLMLGFYADYDSGELAPDGVEIIEADWYHYSDLPPHPNEYTLSGQLIRGFVSRYSK
ncbi:NAD(+) diphosphatase [Porticoccus sp. W117]|uniref:NAD(+) diphosphatase n=1 Tax=Porticoccus sp. W117 TaxID=3054777 RepID=UPI002591DC9D|nr:NAD(+) diphosphatase [Porticoccus sp. W117]MDM3871189.1 NAD(+) diphosphatase [Porticoccus sp. W117]